MKHFFLVDFENVSDSGLNGFFTLTESDSVFVFYSSKANKISIEFIDRLNRDQPAAKLSFIKVYPGNQALDMQLASFLGSLILKNDPADTEYIIISKDKGFECLPKFWNEQDPNIRVSARHKISENPDPAPSAPEAGNGQKAEGKAEGKTVPAAELNAAEQKVVPQAEAKTQKAAELKAAPQAEPNAASQAEANVPITELKAAPQAEAKAAQPAEQKTAQQTEPKAVKPAEQKQEQKAARPQPRDGVSDPAASKTALNAMVQQVLSKANKFDSSAINGVASLVARNFGNKTIKKNVYQSVIKQYGQKNGLEMYNMIKPLLK